MKGLATRRLGNLLQQVKVQLAEHRLAVFVFQNPRYRAIRPQQRHGVAKGRSHAHCIDLYAFFRSLTCRI